MVGAGGVRSCRPPPLRARAGRAAVRLVARALAWRRDRGAADGPRRPARGAAGAVAKGLRSYGSRHARAAARARARGGRAPRPAPRSVTAPPADAHAPAAPPRSAAARARGAARSRSRSSSSRPSSPRSRSRRYCSRGATARARARAGDGARPRGGGARAGGGRVPARRRRGARRGRGGRRGEGRRPRDPGGAGGDVGVESGRGADRTARPRRADASAPLESTAERGAAAPAPVTRMSSTACAGRALGAQRARAPTSLRLPAIAARSRRPSYARVRRAAPSWTIAILSRQPARMSAVSPHSFWMLSAPAPRRARTALQRAGRHRAEQLRMSAVRPCTAHVPFGSAPRRAAARSRRSPRAATRNGGRRRRAGSGRRAAEQQSTTAACHRGRAQQRRERAAPTRRPRARRVGARDVGRRGALPTAGPAARGVVAVSPSAATASGGAPASASTRRGREPSATASCSARATASGSTAPAPPPSSSSCNSAGAPAYAMAAAPSRRRAARFRPRAWNSRARTRATSWWAARTRPRAGRSPGCATTSARRWRRDRSISAAKTIGARSSLSDGTGARASGSRFVRGSGRPAGSVSWRGQNWQWRTAACGLHAIDLAPECVLPWPVRSGHVRTEALDPRSVRPSPGPRTAHARSQRGATPAVQTHVPLNLPNPAGCQRHTPTRGAAATGDTRPGSCRVFAQTARRARAAPATPNADGRHRQLLGARQASCCRGGSRRGARRELVGGAAAGVDVGRAGRRPGEPHRPSSSPSLSSPPSSSSRCRSRGSWRAAMASGEFCTPGRPLQNDSTMSSPRTRPRPSPAARSAREGRADLAPGWHGRRPAAPAASAAAPAACPSAPAMSVVLVVVGARSPRPAGRACSPSFTRCRAPRELGEVRASISSSSSP